MTLPGRRIARPRRQRSLLSTSAPLALMLALAAGPALADGLPIPDVPPPNPGTNWSGAAPAAGYDSLAASGTVNVTAPRAYAEWSEFNIDPGNTLNINGQGPDWILVNKVTGPGSSTLEGTVNANGQVWLLNQNGILATNTSVFNVGGLLLSTAQGFNVSNFLTPGSLQWDFTDALAGIQMNGQVNAAHGVVALIGPNIGVGTSAFESGGGTITETAPGVAQFVAVSAQDVSLAFTDVGTVLQLDGVTINRGITSGGGVNLDDTAVISLGRVFVAAAGESAPSQILVSGNLTATQARADGQDIVLMATDNASPSQPVVVADHVSGQPDGHALESAVTTTTGGDIILYSPLTAFDAFFNSQDGVVVDPAAAPGASLFVRAAGGVQLSTINNPAGDIDIQALAPITDQIGPDIYVIAAGDITLSDMLTDLTTAHDIAVLSQSGDVTLASADAGDDIVVRAFGSVTVTGHLTTWAHDSQLNLNEQAGDILASNDPITAYSVDGPGGLDGTTFGLVGADIDIKAGSIAIAGLVDATGDGSDARFQATGSIDLGDVIAEHDPSDPSPVIDVLDEDILIDAGGNVSTGDLFADRDIAARSFGGALSIGAADAGDDVVLRAAEGVSTLDITTHGLDTDNPDQSGFLLIGADPMIAFSASGPFASDGVVFDIQGADIDIKGASVTVDGLAQANGFESDARFQATGSIFVGAADASRDVLIDAGVDVTTGGLSAGRDVAARAYGGSMEIGDAIAGDDVVLRAANDISVVGFDGDPSSATLHATGLASSGDDGDTSGVGDLLAGLSRIDLNGFFPMTGSNVDVKTVSGAIDVGGVTTADGPLGGDARFQAGGAVTTGDVVSESGDVLIDGSLVGKSAQVPLSPFVETPSNSLSAGRDIVVRSTTGAVAITSAEAGDDLAIRAATDVTVDGPLVAGSVGDALGVADQLVAPTGGSPMIVEGAVFEVLSGAGNSDIDVVAGGDVLVAGGSSAVSLEPSGNQPNGSDVRFQADGAVTLGGAAAGGDVLVDAGQAVAITETLLAGRDVGVRSAQSSILISTPTADGAVRAGDDVVLRAATDITITGRIATYGANDAASPDQAGDLFAGADPVIFAGQSLDVAGGADIDVRAGGDILVGPNSAGASGFGSVVGGANSDVRLQAGGGIGINNAAASRDVLLDAGQDLTVDKAVQASRDVAVRSASGAVSLGSVQAGDDVAIRAAGTVTVAGSLASGVGADGLGVADRLITPSEGGPMTVAGVSFNDLTGTGNSDIDVVAGAITVGGQTTAGGAAADARFQALGGIGLAGVTAGQDVLADGSLKTTGSVASVDAGALIAGRDVGVRSGQGAVTIGSAQAGDDIVLRANLDIVVDGGGAPSGANLHATGLASANADNNAAGAGDLLFIGDPSALSGAFLLTGSNVDVLSTLGNIDVWGDTTVDGPRGGDARYRAGGSLDTGDVDAASGDVLLDGAAVGRSAQAATNAVSAGRDIAVRGRTGGVTLASATAADDVAIRAAGTVTVTGPLSAGTGADAFGVADRLIAPAESGPMSFQGATFSDLTGTGNSDVDVVAGAIAVGGATSAAGAGADVRLQAQGGISLAGVTAGQDILADGSITGAAASVGAAGAVVAGRDVAVRSGQGAVTLASVQAGDDIVLRAATTIAVSGPLTTLSGAGAGSDQVGDRLAASDPILTYWATTADPYTTADGHDVDIRAGGAIALGGAATAQGAASDIRLDSKGATVSAASLTLSGGQGGEQVLVAGTDFAVSGQINAAGGDVLLFSRAPSATLGGPAVGLGSGFTFDNAEASRTTAASLNVFSGVSAGQSGNLAVQDLQLTSGLRTVRVYAGPGARAEVFGQVTDIGGVGGVFEVGTAATDPQRPQFVHGAAFRALATTWTPDVVRVSGGIGATGTPFGRVELAGQTIYIAPRNDAALGGDFEQAAAVTPPELLPTYAGPVSVQVRVGVLELRASNAILERNLQPTPVFLDGRGLELGRLFIDRLSPAGAIATRVSLFGLLDVGQGGVLPPAATGGLVGGVLPAFLLRFAPYPNAAVPYSPDAAVAANYRFNGCAFGGQSCFTLPNPNQLPPDLDPSATPLVEGSDSIGDVSDPFTSVDEDPVTNSGSEIEWSAKPTLEQR